MTIELANRLIEFRKKHNLSQEQLANKLHVSRQTISKWERSESSPDTDNLIELAKLYNIPLDDLLNCQKDIDAVLKESTDSETTKSYTKDTDEYTSKEEDDLNSKKDNSFHQKEGEVHADFGPFHVHAKSDDGDSVYIGKKGIHVEEKNGDSVHISSDGINVNGMTYGNIDSMRKRKTHYSLIKSVVSSLSMLFALIAYLILGFTLPNQEGWIIYWPLFILALFLPSFVDAFEHKSFSRITVPLLILFVYCMLGMMYSMWHPMWILFLIIPVYYIVVSPIDKLIKEHRKRRNAIDADIIFEENDDDD
ncbi:MAG: helix-turn-helix domain-containing protein [Bacilli bacterium]|nr:helix-turn-helix domain-containing protein [Bacilli bacterium]